MVLAGRLFAAHIASSVASDRTSVSDDLNNQIRASKGGAYGSDGGDGIVVRTADFLNEGDSTVIPATFWHNDLQPPSQLYPTAGIPWCPHGQKDGFYDIAMPCDGPAGNNGPWEYASVAIAIGAGGMQTLFPELDRIHDADYWGYGVFYAADANSADQRCFYSEEYNGWDCPGGWIDSDGIWYQDAKKKGGGYQPMGNPELGYGGGSGCHFDTNQKGIDQQDAWDGSGNNLVQNAHCECNYAFKSDWAGWVRNFIDNTQQKGDFTSRTWLNGGGGKMPQWGMDSAVCWVNNPTDMVKMQNAIWRSRMDWNNQKVPLSNWGSGQSSDIRKYWGWNEVPATRSVMDDPLMWDSVIIKLPSAICPGWGGDDKPECLSDSAQRALEDELAGYVNAKKLLLGLGNAGYRPGSYILFAREYSEDKGSTWKRWFFCQEYTTIGHKYSIHHIPIEGNEQYGACYIDEAAGPAPTPQPPSPPPSVRCTNCDGCGYQCDENGHCSGCDDHGWCTNHNAEERCTQNCGGTWCRGLSLINASLV